MGALKRINIGDLELSALFWGDGPKHALLLHGFPDTADGMAPLATRLAQAGYTVCAPYLRGYHPSDQAPDGRYDIAALSGDILAVLDRLNFQDTLLIGHDWGAVIAGACAAQDVQRIERVVLLSVPPIPTLTGALLKHPSQLYRSRYMTYFQMGSLSEHLVARNNYAYIDSLWSRWSPDLRPPVGHLEDIKMAFSHPGGLKAALSYYRALIPFMNSHWRENWRLVNAEPRCAMTVAVGRNDGCIAPMMFENCAHPTTIIENAGHFLVLEQPDAVAALCLEA